MQPQIFVGMFLGPALPGSKGMGSVRISSVAGSLLVTSGAAWLQGAAAALAPQGHCRLNPLSLPKVETICPWKDTLLGEYLPVMKSLGGNPSLRINWLPSFQPGTEEQCSGMLRQLMFLPTQTPD